MDIDMLINFFKSYGWQIGLLALSGMVILGFLKWIGRFKKLPTSDKKYVYYAINCSLSIIACTIYIIINNSFEISSWLILSGAVILLTGMVYNVWENSGLRLLWKKAVLDNISKLFKLIFNRRTKEEIKKKKALKLGSEILSQLAIKAQQVEAQKLEDAKLAQEKAQKQAEEILKKQATQVAKKQE